ncbi:biopolymer transporter ExbD [Deltaproteobacteria bacterium OttesenSCG-928-M10]|nr:biopolymer transporter ExbD [Deltaproteobacteria bacterium OttesenSCG-928-M10]
MNFREKAKNRTPDINLTPLVDVVLLLVLFFMVTSQFAVMPGLNLLLPSVDPQSQVRVPPAERLEISVTAAGDIFFEDQPTTLNNLPLHLERTGAAGDEVVIVVSADRTVPYGRIVKIMDTLRLEGFNRVVFAARGETGEERTDE